MTILQTDPTAADPSAPVRRRRGRPPGSGRRSLGLPAGADRPESRFEPPAIPHPTLGQEVPVPDPEQTCPHCGSSRACWTYNPRSRRGVRGWVLQRRLICCRATDPLAPRDPSAPTALSQQELDREFGQEVGRGQTFLAFDWKRRPWLVSIAQALERYAHAFRLGETRRGVFLAGADGSGKTHLVHTLVNQARALGIPALSVSLRRLLDLCLPEAGETPRQRTNRNERRAILRHVPVLAIRDLGCCCLDDLRVRELIHLLAERERRGLVTHWTGVQTPARYRKRPYWGNSRAAITALTESIERLCAPILTCDRGEAFAPPSRPQPSHPESVP